MPHLVANFLRSSTNGIPSIKKGSRSRNASCETSRNNSVSGSPCSSDSEEHAVKPPEFVEAAVKKHNRLGLHFGRSSSASSSALKERASAAFSSSPAGPATITCSIESPPVVFHGSREESTGALFSGQLFIDVKEDVVEVESFVASLSIRTTHQRPYQGHCKNCQHHVTKLETWQLLAHQTPLRRGKHAFPFSTLLGGDLPASMDTPVVSISYEFHAEAVFSPGQSFTQPSLTFDRNITVKRSLPEPLYPHHSVRVFPPTNIKASADYTSVIHPSGNHSLTFKLDGLMTHNDKFKTVDIWKLRKVTWRLEETIKTIAPACDRHVSGAPSVTDDTKGVVRSETRVIGEKEMHRGWKSDYTGTDGTVDMELEFCVNRTKPNSNELKYACDSKLDNGTEVTHSLLLELIVSKEYAAVGKAHQANATGSGRILRMHFGVVMTEFPGMGVSWDNEAPPIYEDVPPSPPAYPQEQACSIEHEDLEPLYAQRCSVEPEEEEESASSSEE